MTILILVPPKHLGGLNIFGNNNPFNLGDFVEALEKALGKTAKKEFLSLQPSEITDTSKNVS